MRLILDRCWRSGRVGWVWLIDAMESDNEGKELGII